MGSRDAGICYPKQPMEIKARRQRFRDRLSVEREVLAIVNSLPDVRPLTGLTEAAVSLWCAQNRVADLSAISNLVLEISRRLALDVDNSRDVFENELLMRSTSVEDTLALLKARVQRVPQ
jgi:hypothetical protein